MYTGLHFRLLVWLCMLSAPAFAQGVDGSQLYRLRVVVKDSITGRQLQDASVAVTLGGHQHSHLTDHSGSTVFEGLKAGAYAVSGTYLGYHPGQERAVLPLDEEVVLLLCPASFHLHETVIEAKALNSTGIYSLQSVSVMNAEQVERMRGQNLGELLKQVNGITLLNTGPGVAKPVLRGLHSNRLVMMNNGIRQEGQQWGAEHAPEIDPFTVSRVEVVKGAASVEFGPEAIGGAIRLSPREYRTTTGIGGEVSLQGFSNNRQGAASAMLEGTHTLHGQYSWRLQGSLRKAGDSHAPGYVISNTGLEEQNGSFSFAYKYKKLSVEFFSSIFTTRIGIMRAAHIGSSTDLYRAMASNRPLIIHPFTYAIGKPSQQVWHQVQSAKIGYHFKAGQFYIQAGRQLNSRQEYDLGVSWNPQSTTRTSPAYDLSLTTLTTDIAFEHRKWHHITGKFGVSVMNQSNYTAGTQRPIIPNFVSVTSGIFIFEKWSKGRWTAEAGARADARDQSVYVRKSQAVERTDRSFHSASFVTGGAYAISDRWKVSTTVSSAWRPPAINELYSNGLHNGTATFEVGNPNLASERSYNLDVNIKYRHERGMAELSAYRNRISDFIYQLPVQPPTITLRGTFPTFAFMQTNVVLQGAEAGSTWQLGKYLQAGVSLTYLHAQDISNDRPLIYMPAARSRLSLQYQLEKFWKTEHLFAEIAWSYVDRQRRFPQGLDYLNPPAAYNLVDVSAGFEVPVGHQHIRLSAGINNLLNVSCRDYLNRFRYFTDEPGRNIIVRVTIPFSFHKQ
jgi:iron complex outermembrane receptor protein